MFEPGQTIQEFLRDYYTVGPRGYALRGAMPDEQIKKILTVDESNYFNNGYGLDIFLNAPNYTELWKLLDKRPLTQVGDSFKYATSNGLYYVAAAPGGSDAVWGSETETSLTPVSKILSGISKVSHTRDLTEALHEKVPGVVAGIDWAQQRDVWLPDQFYKKLDTWLGGYETASNVHGVDTPAAKNIENIDRLISTQAESGATNHVSAATDGDIFWDGVGTGTAKFDRSATTAADAQLKLPTTPGTEEAYDIVDELETLMTEAKKYSKRKRYIGITTGKTMNKIQNEIAPGKRYLDSTSYVSIGINGVETRAGAQAGMPVQSLDLAGVKVPMFTAESLPTKNSVYTTATSGHAYLIDLDTLYIRVDQPPTYIESNLANDLISVNKFLQVGVLFTASQLVCNNFQAQAALKWIKA